MQDSVTDILITQRTPKNLCFYIIHPSTSGMLYTTINRYRLCIMMMDDRMRMRLPRKEDQLDDWTAVKEDYVIWCYLKHPNTIVQYHGSTGEQWNVKRMRQRKTTRHQIYTAIFTSNTWTFIARYNRVNYYPINMRCFPQILIYANSNNSEAVYTEAAICMRVSDKMRGHRVKNKPCCEDILISIDL